MGEPEAYLKPPVNTAIADERLDNQRITGAAHRRPADVVAWLGAVQAQEYPAARWGLGLRMPEGTTDAEIERAFDEGTILRTHVMRPTWHFVTPADIRWMLELTAPRVHRTMASYSRQHGLDQSILTRATAVFERALGDGQYLTRAELGEQLRARPGTTAEGRERLEFRSRSCRYTPSSKGSSAAARAAGSRPPTRCWRNARPGPGACHATRRSPSSRGGTLRAMAPRRSGTSSGGQDSRPLTRSEVSRSTRPGKRWLMSRTYWSVDGATAPAARDAGPCTCSPCTTSTSWRTGIVKPCLTAVALSSPVLAGVSRSSMRWSSAGRSPDLEDRPEREWTACRCHPAQTADRARAARACRGGGALRAL